MYNRRLALFLAFWPGVFLLGLAALTGNLSPYWAGGIALSVVIGGAWVLKQPYQLVYGEGHLPLTDGRDGAILDSLPDPVVMLDRKRRVVSTNAAGREILNISQTGDDLSRWMRHPEILDAASLAVADGAEADVEIFLPGQPRRAYHVLLRTHDGGTRDDSPVAVAIFHDMTARNEAERMRADFVANVSHELRTPLSALSGFIETLEGPARDDVAARTRFLGIMREEANRMGRLIDDLLSLSRVEANAHVPPAGRVQVEGVIRGVAGTLSERARSRGMTIGIVCSTNLPDVIGDADQLTQVFQNLVDNAIKYGPEATPILIEATRLDRMPGTGDPGVSVAVSDEGGGISPEDMPRLTERFYRIDKARSREVGGTGLGLAIVKHIVNRHRGRLNVKSEAGKGTTFTVLLRSVV
ncbi:MAG: ATP-binding protein [Rhodospirillales bacterium]|nr:ATP-binding protein [Rhodospirillales bacterium]